MASESNPTDAPNRCDVVEPKAEQKKQDPIPLSRFLSPLTAAETFQRTADYARDPEAYLKHALGSETFSQRKDLLSIPGKVDKDVYGAGEHKAHFQQHIAELLSKDHGLFFLTGVQAQLAALKIHCERAGNRRVAWHVTSHLESAEMRAYEMLYGLERTLLGTREDELPTVEEIKKGLELPPEQRPAAILVELPNRVLGCKTYTFSELEALSSACKEAGVKFHLDGARIWEIEPYYYHTAGKTFADIGKLFDSVYVSFYKGLRGATGAILVSNDEDFIKEAKTWQRRAGGNAFSLAYEVADCERGYNENIGTFKRKWDKMAEVVEAITTATSKYTNDGERIVKFLPEKPTCCQIRTLFQGYTADELLAARDKVVEKLNVKIFDRLWPKKTLDEQAKEEDEKGKGSDGSSTTKADKKDDRTEVFEWMILSQGLELETKVFVDTYVALCEELVKEE